MSTRGQRKKKKEKSDRAKLNAAKSAAKIGVQGASEVLAHHEKKASDKILRSGNTGGAGPRL